MRVPWIDESLFSNGGYLFDKRYQINWLEKHADAFASRMNLPLSAGDQNTF